MEIDEINIIYNIKDLNVVQLFGEDFVRRYKNTTLIPYLNHLIYQ